VAIYDASDNLVGMINVEVGADTPDLADAIREAVPRANVRVESINGRTRLTGTVPDAIALRKILELAAQYGDNVVNALRVTGGQQVMLEVRFVEADRNAGRELGISFAARRAGDNSGRGVSLGAVNPPQADQGNIYNPLLPSSNPPFGTLIANVLNAGIQADILIQALEDKRLGRRLAEPNLIALSGDTASFFAGGEFPYSLTRGRDDPPAVDFKRFGVQLNFTPTVLDNGLINLRLDPEVSEISSFSREGQPILSTRRLSTVVDVRDGQSFAVAGLLRSIHTKNQQQLPWLGQLPIIGALFRSSAFREEETDLVIIVTPRLVQPTKPGRPLATPLDKTKGSNDVEFFLLGALEVDNKTIKKFQDGTGVIGPYGHVVDLPNAKTVRGQPKAATAPKTQVVK
jgi:pilus assembly protein CpaC